MKKLYATYCTYLTYWITGERNSRVKQTCSSFCWTSSAFASTFGFCKKQNVITLRIIISFTKFFISVNKQQSKTQSDWGTVSTPQHRGTSHQQESHKHCKTKLPFASNQSHQSQGVVSFSETASWRGIDLFLVKASTHSTTENKASDCRMNLSMPPDGKTILCSVCMCVQRQLVKENGKQDGQITLASYNWAAVTNIFRSATHYTKQISE